MIESVSSLGRLDRAAIALSALCGVHCVGTVVLTGLMVSVGSVLEAPIIHEVGLVLAILLGTVALGVGVLRHGVMLPAGIGLIGLGTMASALTLPHGVPETVATLVGVAIVSVAHWLNGQASHSH
jgi:hypothetical protein